MTDETRPTCKETCRWGYTGVRFRDGSYARPGGSARTRYYAHHYLCTSCGLTRIERIDSVEATTFDPILYNASPGTREEFPIEQEKTRYGT